MFERARTGLADIIRRAARVKVDIVREDPFESGRRAALNLGHTIGHGIEAASNYALRHGEAIALGLIAEAKLAERIGLAQQGLSDRIERVIDRVDLPPRYSDLDPQAILSKMQSDKKKLAGRLKFVLPRDVGDVVVGIDVKDDVVKAVLDEMRAGTA